jgi:hypothetical protein
MKSPWLLALILMSTVIAAAQTAPAGPSSVSEVFNSGLANETAQASSATFSYTVAHFPYGQGWSTRISTANGGITDATVNVKFFNSAGAPTSVPLEGEQGLQTGQQFVVHRNEVQVFGAELSQRNNPKLQVAWATVTSTAPVNVFSLFDYGPNPPAIIGAVGAQSTAPSKTFRFPVSVGGTLKYNAGMAISSPNAGTTVTVKVLNADGSTKGTFTETLPTNGQTLFLLDSKVSFDKSTLFNGSVAVCATQPVGLVALGVEYASSGLFTIAVTTDPCP